MKKYHAVIDGQLIITEKSVGVISPVTLDVYGEVSSLSPSQINDAFVTSRASYKKWTLLNFDERIELIYKWIENIKKNESEILDLIVYEVGKTKKEAQAEFDRTIEYVEETIKEAKKMMVPNIIGYDIHHTKNKIGNFYRVSKGVGVSISPFNYPLNLSFSKIIPALVTGNSVVFKPATNGSLLGAFLGELSIDALPNGVLNVVTGKGSEIGDLIISHKEIDFLSFTGSTRVGKRILEICPSKDVVLELGGKDPAIIVDDSDLDFVAEQIVSGGLSYSGQRCTAIKSVIATDEIIDKLKPILINKVENLKVGSALDDSFIIPLISVGAANFVMDLINDAKIKGANVLVGDKIEKNLVWPTILDNVNKSMDIFDEEPFGPLIPLIRVKNIQEAVEIANESQYGLQASVFGENENELFEIAKKINTGTININGRSQRGPDIFPFIGIRNSGFGVQGIVDALFSTTRVKGIVLNKKEK